MLDRPQTRLRPGRAERDAEEVGRQAFLKGLDLPAVLRGMKPALAAAAERGFAAERKRQRRALLRRT